MMCISLSEVRQIIAFFKEVICPNNRSISNFVDKIDFFHEEDGILSDEPTHSDYLRYVNRKAKQTKKCTCPCSCGANRVSAQSSKAVMLEPSDEN